MSAKVNPSNAADSAGQGRTEEQAVVANHNEHDTVPANSWLQAAQAHDAEYAALCQEEGVLHRALAKLEMHKQCLEQAIAECSVDTTKTKKQQDEEAAIRRLEQALLMDSSSSSEDEIDKSDAESFAML